MTMQPTPSDKPLADDAAAVASRRTAAVDVSMTDWDALFSAVRARLRLTVGPRLAAPNGPQQQREPEVRIAASVLECVAALDQLHATLSHEQARRGQLERELFDAQTALAQLRGELAGTRAAATQARHLALHDGLTLLPNRSFFRMRLDHSIPGAIAGRQALTVLYLDLDGFKAINDEHGHEVGDEVLTIVAARLKRTVRAEDMVSRLGGDEFGCLLEGLPGPAHLATLLAKVHDAVAAPMSFGGLQLGVRASIGVASCPEDGSGGEMLLRNADAAMYRAKRERSGTARFESGTDVWAASTR